MYAWGTRACIHEFLQLNISIEVTVMVSPCCLCCATHVLRETVLVPISIHEAYVIGKHLFEQRSFYGDPNYVFDAYKHA